MTCILWTCWLSVYIHTCVCAWLVGGGAGEGVVREGRGGKRSSLSPPAFLTDPNRLSSSLPLPIVTFVLVLEELNIPYSSPPSVAGGERGPCG